MELELKQRFSWDLESKLTVAERKANLKLLDMRDKVSLEGIHNLLIKNFHQQKQEIEKSAIYKALLAMPKGANHHVHTTAANPIDSYIKLTYDHRVYFNKRESMFKVYPQQNPEIPDGYLKCTTLRAFYESPQKYDNIIRNEILLTEEEANSGSSHEIWVPFEHKFGKIGELCKFVPFFKQLLKTALISHVRQNVYVVEYRHISGTLFDEEKKQLTFLQELKIIREVIDDI